MPVAMTMVVPVVARAAGLVVSPFPVPRPVVVQRPAARVAKPEVAAEAPEKLVLASAAPGYAPPSLAGAARLLCRSKPIRRLLLRALRR